MTRRILSASLAATLLALAFACGPAAYHRGNYLYRHGQFDEAVSELQKAASDNPGAVRVRTVLVRAKLAASQEHFTAAQSALLMGDYDTALAEVQLALYYDPSNQYAQDTLKKVASALQEQDLEKRKAKVSLEKMKEDAQQDLGVPQLDPGSDIPIVLKFSETPLKTILDAVSKASGINFLYDEKAEVTKRVSVDFSKVALTQVLDYLMMQTKHFYKVLDPHTLIVVPDSKQKRDEYQDQVIRTFYLSNADAKDVFQLVRSILQAKKMAMNQDLNSITIEDTPEVVAICQRIIEDNDKSKGEVVVDVVLLEVNSSKMRDIGINMQPNTFTVGPGQNLTYDDEGNPTGIGTGPPVPLNEIGRVLSGNFWIFPVPNFQVRLLMTDADTQVLAKPQLRVMEGQKAQVHIGDKLPVATSNQYLSSTGTQQTYTPIVSYTYQDIGVKIDVEPKVHHNKEITVKLKAEISSVTDYVKGNSLTPDQPVIGTREITTVIRLEDGESSLLAGLIQRSDQHALQGIPGLSEVPGLRRLFSSTVDRTKTTDVVLLLTPHILRMPNITEDDIRPLWVGTADKPSLKGIRSAAASAASKAPAAPAKKEVESKSPESAEEKPEAPGSPLLPKKEEGEKPSEPFNQSAKLLVSPAHMQAKAGDTVLLNLVLVGGKELRGIHAEMEYPNDVLQFQGADEGTFLRLGGAPTSFLAKEVRPGLVMCDMSRTDGSGASGSGLVSRVRFTAQKAGVARVNFGMTNAITAGGETVEIPPSFSIVTVQSPPAGPGGTGGP